MIVFALRHADRTAVGDALTDDGIKRAKLLAQLLGESGVTFAFCSDAVRAHQTLKPLEDRLGTALVVKEIKVEDSPGGPEKQAKEIVSRLNALPSQTVAVVVGHTNTVPTIITGLTGKGVDKIEENQFDKLFVLVIGDAASSVALTRYGEKTPP